MADESLLTRATEWLRRWDERQRAWDNHVYAPRIMLSGVSELVRDLKARLEHAEAEVDRLRTHLEELRKDCSGLVAEKLTEEEDTRVGDTQYQNPFATASQNELGPTLREQIADLQHQQWCGWMAHVFSKLLWHHDGNFYLPGEWQVRWKRQMDTPYAQLSEGERDSDRREADRVFALLESAQLAGAVARTAGDTTGSPRANNLPNSSAFNALQAALAQLAAQWRERITIANAADNKAYSAGQIGAAMAFGKEAQIYGYCAEELDKLLKQFNFPASPEAETP